MEFWESTPAELVPYIESRVNWVRSEMRIENERIGLICATIANVHRDPKKTKPFTPSDFFDLGDGASNEPKRPDPQAFFDQMQRLVMASRRVV